MSEPQKKPIWPWIVAPLIGLPLLYVISSGPARSILMWKASLPSGTVEFQDGTLATVVSSEIVLYGHWRKVYAPLDSVSRGKLGAPLRWYWKLFPILNKL